MPFSLFTARSLVWSGISAARRAVRWNETLSFVRYHASCPIAARRTARRLKNGLENERYGATKCSVSFRTVPSSCKRNDISGSLPVPDYGVGSQYGTGSVRREPLKQGTWYGRTSSLTCVQSVRLKLENQKPYSAIADAYGRRITRKSVAWIATASYKHCF